MLITVYSTRFILSPFEPGSVPSHYTKLQKFRFQTQPRLSLYRCDSTHRSLVSLLVCCFGFVLFCFAGIEVICLGTLFSCLFGWAFFFFRLFCWPFICLCLLLFLQSLASTETSQTETNQRSPSACQNLGTELTSSFTLSLLISRNLLYIIHWDFILLGYHGGTSK